MEGKLKSKRTDKKVRASEKTGDVGIQLCITLIETAGLNTEQVNTLPLLFTAETDKVLFVLCPGFFHTEVCACTHCPRVSAAGWVGCGGRLQVL